MPFIVTANLLASSPFVIRDDLASAFNQAVAEFGQTGAWLDGAQRIAVANEARYAWDCALCKRRKEALSPYAIDGEHDHLGVLPDRWVEAVHRIATDSGRITEKWYDSVVPNELTEDEFIEVLSVTTLISCCDVFTRGIGITPAELPAASAGTPARQRPTGFKLGPGWAPTVAPEDVGPELEGFYDNGPQFIRRSLTLVPKELQRFWELMNAFYMHNPAVVELEGVDRGISRAQMEFLAARVSALLDCFY